MEKGIEQLVGKTLKNITKSDERIEFETTGGEHFLMFHEQDCCESVTVEDISGDLQDIIGDPILVAAESSQSSSHNDSSTWTFYNIGTLKAWVTIRWYGNSNGYYSEAVSFVKR